MGIKVGFFTEGGFEGKITLDNPNIRTDAAWMYLTDATHHPFSRLSFLPDNLYDVGVMILPKKRRMLLNYPLLEQYRRVCKKVTVMQESYYNYWQDSPLDEQIWYFNFITEMDLIFCHNDVDLDYYYGLTNVRTELMPTAMVTEGIVRREGLGNGVIIGGNWVKDYGGFDSYQVSREITDDITAITTGRMKPEETQILKHIPWVMWRDWMDILGQYNVGVQLGTAAAGQFQLNTSFHGIPCIGYSNLNTQSILHPLTTVELGDIDKAKDLARKLKDDKFYKLCMDTTQKRFEKYYSEEMFVKNWKRIWS